MKKKKWIILLITVLIVILLIWSIDETPQTKANRFIKDIQAEAIIDEAAVLPCSYLKEDIKPAYIDSLFKKAKDLITIRIIDKETISFCFTWSSPEPEKYCEIIYKSNDEFDSDYLIPDTDHWEIAYEENKASSYGGGANGKGYVQMTRIKPCWFYVETYLPT